MILVNFVILLEAMKGKIITGITCDTDGLHFDLDSGATVVTFKDPDKLDVKVVNTREFGIGRSDRKGR